MMNLSPLLLLLLLLLLCPAISICAPLSTPDDRLLTNFLPPRTASSTPPPAPTAMRPPRRAAAMSPFASASPLTSFGEAADTALADSVNDAIHSLQNAFLDGTVDDVCGKTDHPDVCVSSVRSMATPGRRLNARSVLMMEMKAAAAATRAALDLVEAFEGEANAGGDTRVRSMLGVCADGYEDALSDLEVAERAAERNDKGTLGSYLSALFSDYGGCGDAFAEAKRASPMEADEDLLTKLASNCLAIAELL